MRTLYGYLCVNTTADQAQTAVEQRIRAFATARGFHLAKIYLEHDPITRSAYYRLFDDLQRFNVHDLVVPSADHLADHQRLRDLRLAQLTDQARAVVHELDGPTADTGGAFTDDA